MYLDAVVLAGGDPEKDAELLAYAGGVPSKALIELGGRTFLEHVVSALLGVDQVRRVAVVGLAPEHCPDLGPQVIFAADRGGMLENGVSGVECLRATGEISERIVTSTCDIPLVTSEVVRDLIARCLPYDVDFCYSIVSQEVMERAFPGSGRTFIPLADGRFAGGDMGMTKLTLLDKNRDKLQGLVGQRKTFWRQVQIVGLSTLVLFLIRRLTIARLEQRVAQVFDIAGKAVILAHAEPAMDVDKPHHLDVVRAAFERRLLSP
jgi:molybdopterin-guanine dinucleotide biosynthesis protein A